MNQFHAWISASVVAFITVGCGGGGGGGEPTAGTLQDVGISSVNLGSSDGNLYVTEGGNRATTMALGLNKGTSLADLKPSIRTGNTSISVDDSAGRWVVTTNSNGLVGGSEALAELLVTNSRVNRFAVVPIAIKVLRPVFSATGTIASAGGSLQTSSGETFRFLAKDLSSPVDVTLTESVTPAGLHLYHFKFSRDVSTENLKLVLPDLNADLDDLSATSATAKSQRKDASQLGRVRRHAVNSSAFPEPYIDSEKASLGHLWLRQEAYFLDLGDHRIPARADIDVNGLLGLKVRRPGMPNNDFDIHKRTSSELSSVIEMPALPMDPTEVGEYEPVLFVHGFLVSWTTASLGGGKGTWAQFPSLARDYANLNGKKLIPFEFRWATDARFTDVADDLVRAIYATNKLTTKRVHVVAHSFGGVLVRTVLQDTASNTPSVLQQKARQAIVSLLTLGTPHSGIGDKNGQATSIKNITLPNGQDAQSFEECDQVSCHVMGENIFKSINPWKDAQLSIIKVDGIPGEQAARLAELDKLKLLPRIPIIVGIGLTSNRSSGVKWDVGDYLISYLGQRFHPDDGDRPLRKGTFEGESEVVEVILGAEGDPKPDDLLTAKDLDSLRRYGYQHSYLTGALNQTNPFFDEDLDGAFEFGLEAAPRLNCGSGSTNCTHAGYLLFKDLVSGNFCKHTTTGCAPSQIPIINQVVDNVGPITDPLFQGATTDDTTPTLLGTFGAALEPDQFVRVFNGGAILGTANVNVSGTSWGFTPTALANGAYSFSAAVVSATGVEGSRSAAWSLKIDTTVPPPPSPTVSAISPTAMDANGLIQRLTISGANLQNANVVQFKWTVEPNAGVWNNAKGTVNVLSNGQIEVPINPGTDRDVIQVRVCRSAAQIADTDCSIPQPLTVTPPKAVPGPNLVVQKLTFDPTSFVAGAAGTVQVNFDVVNLGLGTAAASTGVIRFSPSDQDPAGTQVATFPVPAIPPNAPGNRSPVVVRSIPAPATAGTYWVWVIADVGGTSGENPVDAANNRAVAVSALVVTDPPPPPPPPPVINLFSVIPAFPVARSLATFRFDGTNLQPGYRFSFPGCAETEVVSTSTTRREFTCTLSLDGVNLAGTLTSPQGELLRAFTLTVAPFVTPPQIIIEPSDATVSEGQSATFSVSAIDTTTPNGEASQFQWRRDGVNIAGATAKSYTTPLTNLAADNGRRFAVVVSNAGGPTPSRAALLTVTNAQAGAGYYMVATAGPSVFGTASPGSLPAPPFSPSLVGISTLSPGTTKIVEPAGQWSPIGANAIALEGTVNPATRQMTGLRQRFTAYVKGPRLYQVHHVAGAGGPVGQPLSTQPVTEVCLLAAFASAQPDDFLVHNDFAAPAQSVMVYRVAGPDQVCRTADDAFRAIRFGMTATDVPLVVPKVLTSIFSSVGGISGFIVQSGSLVQRVDANFQNPVTVPGVGTVSFSYATGFGSTLPGYWIFAEGASIKAFNLAALAAPITLFNLTFGESLAGAASDTASFYVAINSAATARVIRVDHNLNVVPIASLPARVDRFALTPSRVIFTTGASVQALLTSPSAPTVIATAPLPVIDQLVASGENVYIGARDAVNPARTVRIVRSDGTSAQDIGGAVLIQGVLPSSDNFWLNGGTFGVLIAEGWSPANGAASATLKLYEGATRAQLVSFGSFPASPPAELVASTSFLQHGQFGLVSFVPRPAGTAAPILDLFLFKTDAVGLTRATNQVSAAQVQSVPFRLPSTDSCIGNSRCGSARATIGGGMPLLRKPAAAN